MQVVSDMDVSTRLSGSSLNLFYTSWTRLLREVVRRVVVAKKNDPAIKDFFRRCADRGVPESFIKTLDLSKTRAVRSIGSGSYANRLVALRELQGISGQFDEIGRRNLTRDIVATRVGHDLADRYVPANAEPRPTIDVKIAFLENQQLALGQAIPVIGSEMHGTHLQLHVPALNQLIEALNTGQADPMQSLGSIQAFYQHVSETLQFAGQDASLQGVTASAKQVLQYAEEVINNTMKSLEKMQRDAAQNPEAQGDGSVEQGAGSPPVDLKIQQAQIQMDITRQKAELDMELKQRKFEQEQAMRDAEAALKFRENMGV